MTQHIISDTDTNDTSSRNTNIRARCWGPNTWNNYTAEDLAMLELYLKNECEEGRINPEVGENGTPHLQFCLKFKNARYFAALKKQFPEVHWERSRNWIATLSYCSKIETAVGPTIIHNKRKRTVKDPLEGREMRPIQQEIITITDEEPDDRTIVWVVDPEGGAGKTTLAKHLCINRPREVLYIGGKSSDIKYGITQFLDNPDNHLRIVIIDLTRSLEGFVSYEGLEAVKNGIFYNTKYESQMVVFDNPHVVVFANFAPDESKMSADRWNIIEV